MEEVQGVLKVRGVEVVQEQDGVHGDVDGVQGEVENVDDDVEVTEGQVQELEDEFERLHTNIQDLFQRVDRATNVGATEARISATPRYIRTTNLAQDVDSSGFIRTYSNPSSTC
jgi:predicted nuclease with TOPRIM domain